MTQSSAAAAGYTRALYAARSRAFCSDTGALRRRAVALTGRSTTIGTESGIDDTLGEKMQQSAERFGAVTGWRGV